MLEKRSALLTKERKSTNIEQRQQPQGRGQRRAYAFFAQSEHSMPGYGAIGIF